MSFLSLSSEDLAQLASWENWLLTTFTGFTETKVAVIDSRYVMTYNNLISSV